MRPLRRSYAVKKVASTNLRSNTEFAPIVKLKNIRVRPTSRTVAFVAFALRTWTIIASSSENALLATTFDTSIAVLVFLSRQLHSLLCSCFLMACRPVVKTGIGTVTTLSVVINRMVITYKLKSSRIQVSMALIADLVLKTVLYSQNHSQAIGNIRRIPSHNKNSRM